MLNYNSESENVFSQWAVDILDILRDCYADICFDVPSGMKIQDIAMRIPFKYGNIRGVDLEDALTMLYVAGLVDIKSLRNGLEYFRLTRDGNEFAELFSNNETRTESFTRLISMTMKLDDVINDVGVDKSRYEQRVVGLLTDFYKIADAHKPSVS